MDTKLILEILHCLRAKRFRVLQQIAVVEQMMPGHVSDHDLERYHLGMVESEAELAPLEEHILGCGHCAERTEATADYVDAVRAAIIEGNFDLE